MSISINTVGQLFPWRRIRLKIKRTTYRGTVNHFMWKVPGRGEDILFADRKRVWNTFVPGSITYRCLNNVSDKPSSSGVKTRSAVDRFSYSHWKLPKHRRKEAEYMWRGESKRRIVRNSVDGGMGLDPSFNAF